MIDKKKRPLQRKGIPWVWFERGPEHWGISFTGEAATWKLKGFRGKHHAIIVPSAMWDRLQSAQLRRFFEKTKLNQQSPIINPKEGR